MQNISDNLLSSYILAVLENDDFARDIVAQRIVDAYKEELVSGEDIALVADFYMEL